MDDRIREELEPGSGEGDVEAHPESEGRVKEYILEDGVLREEGGADPETVPSSPSEEGALRERVAELEGELAAARADFYNYRQRMAKERQQIRRLVTDDTISSLLPVLDNLDRALTVPEDGSAKDVLVGVGMVRRQFLSTLEELGVRVIPTEGAPFDPALHDAVETVPVEDPEQDGRILEELTRGYRTDERVLRASRVTVGKA
ncbi:nucleotide exchange factor GrpE [uncultured Fretibacterium sp.]|uniref:nucleotide exchange factor GrpE n=1 Tax=uncultured Fretibacterium sp. TaxID=1678694 RepID=UPI0026028E2F|nr:nucleotide exchange factor GrpE [uncultured Fretibacterium sp.]